MNSLLIQIGDNVTINIDEESRQWGYNPLPNGTKVKVIGFGEVYYHRTQNFGHRPGIYVNKCLVKIKTKDNDEHNINHVFLTLNDKKEYKKRTDKYKKDPELIEQRTFLRELPETPFWEWDVVQIPFTKEEHVIQGIDYNWINPGEHYYRVSKEITGSTQSIACGIKLLKRGNVWKFDHNEPITFSNIREEAYFYQTIGHIREIKNPNTNNYNWTKQEIIQAMKNGTVHGFYGDILGESLHKIAIVYNNGEVGSRIRKAVLDVC